MFQCSQRLRGDSRNLRALEGLGVSVQLKGSLQGSQGVFFWGFIALQGFSVDFGALKGTSVAFKGKAFRVVRGGFKEL